jgi:RNA polymerase sigma-70 factor (ECF subfamily)
VEALTPDQRLILLLSYHDGLSHTAAAEVLGIPIGTLKSRLHAALTQLRARLSPEAVQ